VAISIFGFNMPSGLIRPVHLSNCDRGLGCTAGSWWTDLELALSISTETDISPSLCASW
jgi:hypothetical protein